MSDKKILLLLLVLLSTSSATINVVTSIPDLADITKNIGRDSVNVFSLAVGTEDMHRVNARSSFLPILNRADLLFNLGLFAEKLWLPDLVSSCRNKNIMQGNPGWVEVYGDIEILEKTTDAVKAGHHTKGNPHYNNSPATGRYMAKKICEALISVNPQAETFFKKNLVVYLDKLVKLEERLLLQGVPLKGQSIISYHADLAYFCKYYGMNITGTLEPAPGVDPTAVHLSMLVKKAKEENVALILYHQAQNPRIPNSIAQKTGARAVCFANMVQSRPTIKNFIQLHEYNLEIMLTALKEKNGSQ